MKSIFLLLFPLCVFAAYMKWGSTIKISGNSNPKRHAVVHRCLATKVVHIFWEELGEDKDWHLFYRSRLSTGELTEKVQIGPERPLPEFYNQISVQSTKDGKHILLAYGGYRERSNKGCTVWNAASCIESYFTESLNGGKTWSIPKHTNHSMDQDTHHRSMPSLSLEKDTGRVYITHLYDMNSAMDVREPGRTYFNIEERLDLYVFGMTMNMGYTISKKDKKRYLHLVWQEINSSDNTKNIRYSRSEDGGKTWTKGIDLVARYKGESVPKVVIDTDAAEGDIYVQYSEEQALKILVGVNHGKTWLKPSIMGKVATHHDAMTLCGSNGKGEFFTISQGKPPFAGILKYVLISSPISYTFTSPFAGVKDGRNPSIHCSQGDETTGDKTTLVIAVLDATINEILMIVGELIE